MDWIRILDITASVLTVVSLWNVSKSRKYWLLYFPGTVCFVVVTSSKGLWGLTVMGLILCLIALKNYFEGSKMITIHEYDDPDNPKNWIGVDFDGTLAVYKGWQGPGHVGEPIQKMVDLVRKFLEQGQTVKIFTARVHPSHGRDSNLARTAIQIWCKKYLGQELEVVCEKDGYMTILYDDRVIQVKTNTGEFVDAE